MSSKNEGELGMVAHTCNPSTLEIQAGEEKEKRQARGMV
jgi:hypothetical protein